MSLLELKSLIYMLENHQLENLPTEQEVARSYLNCVLKAHGNNQTLAAKAVKMDRTTLWRRLGGVIANRVEKHKDAAGFPSVIAPLESLNADIVKARAELEAASEIKTRTDLEKKKLKIMDDILDVLVSSRTICVKVKKDRKLRQYHRGSDSGKDVGRDSPRIEAQEGS